MAQILIVEDEANIRRVLRKILIDVDKNINISEAADGVEAISMVDDKTYDLAGFGKWQLPANYDQK